MDFSSKGPDGPAILLYNFSHKELDAWRFRMRGFPGIRLIPVSESAFGPNASGGSGGAVFGSRERGSGLLSAHGRLCKHSRTAGVSADLYL